MHVSLKHASMCIPLTLVEKCMNKPSPIIVLKIMMLITGEYAAFQIS